MTGENGLRSYVSFPMNKQQNDRNADCRAGAVQQHIPHVCAPTVGEKLDPFVDGGEDDTKHQRTRNSQRFPFPWQIVQKPAQAKAKGRIL